MFASTFPVRRFAFTLLALAGWFGLGSSVQAATVQLISLRAVVTEDDNGDQLRLKISTDGGSERILKHNLRNGQVWKLNETIKFHLTVRLRLLDYDPTALDRDELLGTVTINNATGLRTALFNREGAHYVLTYRVIASASFKVRLMTLRAIKTEDDDGDQLRLKFRPDSAGESTLSRNMRNGEVWIINRDINFNAKVDLRLIDYDATIVDRDEHLGSVTIHPVAGIRTALFNRNGAHYVLTFRVSPP